MFDPSPQGSLFCDAVEIDAIRACIRRGNFFVTDHALTEGFKDGISVADMLHVIETGKIIERCRARRSVWSMGTTRMRFLFKLW